MGWVEALRVKGVGSSWLGTGKVGLSGLVGMKSEGLMGLAGAAAEALQERRAQSEEAERAPFEMLTICNQTTSNSAIKAEGAGVA
jgi:hypothetical protein